MRERADVVDVHLARAPGVDGAGLRGMQRALEAHEPPGARDGLEPAPLPAQRRAAAVGVDPVESRAQRDLKQALAVEARRERLADAPQRVLQARALLAQVGQARLEL